jgi:hypothetical protein
MKITSILIALFISLSAYGQNKPLSLSLQLSNPINNNQVGWFEIDGESLDGFNVKNNSFAFGAFLAYNKKEQYSLRFRFGSTFLQMREFGGSSNGVIYDTTHVNGKQTQLSFAPGIIWKINSNKLSLYGGFELPYTYYGKYNLDFFNQQVDLASNTNVFLNHFKTSIPAGYSLGVGALFGFSCSLNQLFSVGAEFSPSIFYYSLGGQTHGFELSNPGIIYYSQDRNSGITGFQNRFSISLTINIVDKNNAANIN